MYVAEGVDAVSDVFQGARHEIGRCKVKTVDQ